MCSLSSEIAGNLGNLQTAGNRGTVSSFVDVLEFQFSEYLVLALGEFGELKNVLIKSIQKPLRPYTNYQKILALNFTATQVSIK